MIHTIILVHVIQCSILYHVPEDLKWWAHMFLVHHNYSYQPPTPALMIQASFMILA
jgi:hypothetical protein